MATAEEREMLRIQKMMEGGPRKAGIISPRSQPAAPAPSPQPKQTHLTPAPMPKQAVSPRAPSSPASVTSPRSAVPSGATYADAREGGPTSTHTIPEEEKTRFVEHINSLLHDDPDLRDKMLINPQGMEFFEKCRDGILLAKLINVISPGSIEINKIHRNKKLTRFNIVENLNHVIAGAKKMGVHVINIGVVDLEEGKTGLVNVMAAQAKSAEEAAKAKANPQEVLLAWFNEQLRKGGSNRVIKNLSSDISDSEGYTILLNVLAPEKCSRDPLNEPDLLKRAELMLQQADKVGVRKFVGPEDIVEGQSKLNFAFLANIYNSLSDIEAARKREDPKPEPPKPVEPTITYKVVGEASKEATATVPAGFLIEARNEKGNLHPDDGKQKIEIRIVGPGVTYTPAVKEDPSNRGVYKVEYSIPSAGSYELHVLVNGNHVAGSPWAFVVHPAPVIEVPREEPPPPPQKSAHSVSLPLPLLLTPPQQEYLETTLQRLQEENEELRRRLREEEEKTMKLRTGVEQTESVKTELQKRMKKLEKALHEKGSSDLAELKRALDTESSEKSELLRQLKDLEEEISDILRKIEKTLKENSDLKNQINEDEKTLASLDQMLRKMDQELEEKDDNIRDLLRQLTELKDLYDRTMERLKKYVYEDWIRNEQIREKQEKPLKISVKDAKNGSLWSGWLLKRGRPIQETRLISFEAGYWHWKRRYFVLKENHLFYFKSDKESAETGKSIRLIGGATVTVLEEFLEKRPKDSEELRKEEIKRRTKVLSEKKREKREAKQKKKEEKERKKCMVRKNVFQLTTPPLGDLMPGKSFFFQGENAKDVNDWVGKLRTAIDNLPSKEQVYMWVIPEAKKIQEASQRLKSATLSFPAGGGHVSVVGAAAAHPQQSPSRARDERSGSEEHSDRSSSGSEESEYSSRSSSSS